MKFLYSLSITSLLFLLGILFAINPSYAQEADTVMTSADKENMEARKAYNSGIENFKNKNYREAINNFNNAIELDPEFEQAFYNRGSVKKKIKEFN